MWVKVVVIILMLAILFSLFRGLFFLNKGGEENSRKLVKSLSWRIGLSLLLFIVVLLLDHYGVINMRKGVLPVDTSQESVVDETTDESN
ncbi:twin transmembrane helix small protein [Kangiella marina]|uniref:Twin transmembrane helix small protein n=1 Tax=Kangiella marina TaxID=1079178 RepID=A0ABP8IHV7_9GAMM